MHARAESSLLARYTRSECRWDSHYNMNTMQSLTTRQAASVAGSESAIKGTEYAQYTIWNRAKNAARESVNMYAHGDEG